ncbi:MAG TPA: Zn-ribbon domain-containing OB-fold protein [Egibacteraceae bacterium]|nr:Zn-ribbon domain-containing OB-fold protein [Egibacteraceae bacterium]
MTATTSRPIAEGLFTWPADEPRLIGAACAACGTTVFPRRSSCPKCGAQDMAERLLSPTGTLWTWTTQGFLPKAPYGGPETDETFQPFALGYVELAGEVRVEARLTEPDPARLRIGMPMRLVVVPFRTDPDGTEVVSFAFAPAD